MDTDELLEMLRELATGTPIEVGLASNPDNVIITSPDGKKFRHQITYVGGQRAAIEQVAAMARVWKKRQMRRDL